MDLSKPTPVWNTLNIYLTTLTNSEITGEKLLSVVGNDSELSFTVQIAEGASEIALDQPHTVNVQGDEVSVFQFISPQGISDKQLDITATSQSNVAAYLKVSQNCKEVNVQKDLEIIDYKKESLRLSFATKGRITLSSVSIPPLTDSVSRWFIGISLKNLSGDVKRSESKSVTLKLTRSFDYSYTTPIFVLLFVSFVVGVLVSIVAYYLLEEFITQVKPARGSRVSNLNLRITYRELFFGPETHYYIKGLVGTKLMIDAFQFVFDNWSTMIQEGDRDKCYYNDFCYKVANHDIPFNLMISNLPYIVHGLILVVWVLMVETKVNLRCKSRRTILNAAAIKKRYSFFIAYAFSWALVFQGLFSALYHLCPNRLTFQFDSAFMFVIAGLTLLLLYNGIDQSRCLSPENVKYQIGAGNFFFIFIVSLFYFNHYGALFNSGWLNSVMQKRFFLFLTLWWFVMDLWAFWELGIFQKIRSGDRNNRLKASVFIILVLLLPPPVIFWMSGDLAQAFLCLFITWSVIAIPIKIREIREIREIGMHVMCTFGFLSFIIWLAAFWVFQKRSTTDKTSSPENSRDKNEECVILGFFDWHDLWHFLSSFALFISAFPIMFLSSEP